MDPRLREDDSGGAKAEMGKQSILIIISIIILDQLTKYWAMQVAPCPILPVLNFVMAYNNGITFGLLPGLSPWIVWGGSVCVMFYIIWELLKARTTPEMIAYSFIIGGAIGNIIDRYRFGFVIDFIDMHLGAIHYPWPFNVADSFIVIGISLLIWHTTNKSLQ